MIDETEVQQQDVQAIPTLLLLPCTTFQIVQSSDLVTDGYLWRSDVEPKLEQNREGVYILTIRNQGEHGKFEMPYISSLIIHADESLCSILTAYHGTETVGRRKDKHLMKGQFYRHYICNDDGIWLQVNWKQLGDAQRRTILTAQSEHAPEWVRAPGKLEEEYKSPKRAHTKMTSYKLVRVIDGRYYSVYKPEEEYVLGQMKRQRAKNNHGGGYYSYPTQEKLLQMFEDRHLFPYFSYREPMTLALLDCEISGRIIEYSNGKWASTFLRPLSVISTHEYIPNQSEGESNDNQR